MFRDRFFTMDYVELTKVYRQKDPVFLSILNDIRDGTVTQPQIDHINTSTLHQTQTNALPQSTHTNTNSPLSTNMLQ